MIDHDNLEEFRNLLEGRRPEPQKFTLPDGGHLVITEQHYYDPMTQIQHYTRHLTFLSPPNGWLRINHLVDHNGCSGVLFRVHALFCKKKSVETVALRKR